MNTNEIRVMYGTKYKKMTKQLLQSVNAAEMIPGKDVLIGIKPNLVGPIPASDGATTHTEVIAGIIEYLKENGFYNLVVLEGSWVGDRTSDALLVTGYDALCAAYDVPFWDMQQDKGAKLECAGMELNVCERALQVDFLINVPVLKGHCQTYMTCALKNMKGLLPNSEKRRFHKMGLHDPIGHLSAGLHQDLIVVDSICGDPTFEDGGNPYQQDRIMIARDPVLCDAYGCSILGIPAEKVEYIGIAEKLGVGCADLTKADIKVLGEEGLTEDEKTHEGVLKTDYRKIMRISDQAEQVDTCSACYASLLPALVKLDEEGLLQKLPEKICIGQGFRGKTGNYGVGNCTREFKHSLKGCPPKEREVEAWLREILAENI